MFDTIDYGCPLASCFCNILLPLVSMIFALNFVYYRCLLRPWLKKIQNCKRPLIKDIKGRFKRFVLPNLLNEPYNAHP
jgi:hypothetical protein